MSKYFFPFINFFVAHPHSQGHTYVSHLLFATEIAGRLSISALFFLFHALVPAVAIPRRFNLSDISAFLVQKDENLLRLKKKAVFSSTQTTMK